MSLTPQSVENIKTTLDNAVKNGAPGLVFHAVDKSGKTLIEHASGTVGVDSDQPMDAQSTMFWIASCTKLITVVAVLQLVEQGKIPLDDAEFVNKIAPELAEKKVYPDGVNAVEKEQEITMRMLLAHKAGFGYRFADPRLKKNGIEGGHGDKNDILDAKLLNQPGKMFEYGVNIDWAGFILERVTGQTLGEYFQQHIFDPLDIPADGATFFPSPSVKKHLARMHQRDPSGTLRENEHLFAGGLNCPPEKQADCLQSGGAGIFSKPKEYVKILAALLNNGTSPTTHKQILKKETVDLLWENQIPDQPDFARGDLTPADPLLVNHAKELYPQPGNPPQGWGFGGFLTIAPGITGRAANTLWWMGLCNLFWWMDREKGVAGIIASQVLPNGDDKVIPAWVMAEKAVYDGLAASA